MISNFLTKNIPAKLDRCSFSYQPSWHGRLTKQKVSIGYCISLQVQCSDQQ